MGCQPAAAHPSYLFPRPETGRINAPFARRVSNTCQNSHDTKGCTQERSPLNVTHVTRPSASRHTYSTTSEHTAMSARSSVLFVKRVSSTAPTSFATCTCILVSTCSNATYVSCTSRSRQNFSTIPATRRAPGHSAVPLVERVLSGHLTFANMSAHTRKSVLFTVTSVK